MQNTYSRNPASTNHSIPKSNPSHAADQMSSTGDDCARIVVPEVFHSLPPGAVKFQGYLGARFEGVLKNRLLAQDLEEILHPFRVRRDIGEWNGEFWGKWFTGLTLAARYSDDPSIKDKMDQAVKGLLATQTPDGYIGCHEGENRYQPWDVWGRKYTILGLLDYHEITSDPVSLRAAQRLANLTIDDIGPGKRSIVELGIFKGMASSSILEPMAMLFQRTGEQHYLDFCRYIVQEWENSTSGPDLVRKALQGVPVALRSPLKEGDLWFTEQNGQHSYSLLTCYEGALHLYRSLGQPELLDACLKTLQDIRHNEMMVVGTGSILECWCSGKKHQLHEHEDPLESCTAILWIKFTRQLLGLTGDSTLMDDIERTAFNALLGSIRQDGGWCTRHNPLHGVRSAGVNQNGPLNCCVVNYPRALFLLREVAVMSDADGPVVNLYAPSQATVPLQDGNRIHIKQQTDYPVTGTVRMVVNPEFESEFTMSLRIPSWSTDTCIEINGEPCVDVKPGSYVRLRRKWKRGDTIVLRLDMSPRIEYAPHSDAPPAGIRSGIMNCQSSNRTHVAVVCGPIVLARDARFGGDVDAAVRLKVEKDNRIILQPVSETKPEHMQMVWRVPTEGGGSILMCDYASAGSTWSAESQYRVWLPVEP